MTLDRRIRSDIEARIQSGEWRSGDRIPFEHELVVTYGCARGTVSKALEGLARSGLIERRRKAGSFVAHPYVQSAMLEVPDLERLITAKGERYHWTCRERRRATVADLGESALPAPALFVEGVHHAGGRPFCLERRLIALSIVPDAEQQTFDTQAPGTWLLDHVAWTQARHAIRATEAKRGDATALKIRVGRACLEIMRATWRLDRAVTEVRQIFPGDRYDLVAEFRPGEHG